MGTHVAKYWAVAEWVSSHLQQAQQMAPRWCSGAAVSRQSSFLLGVRAGGLWPPCSVRTKNYFVRASKSGFLSEIRSSESTRGCYQMLPAHQIDRRGTRV